MTGFTALPSFIRRLPGAASDGRSGQPACAAAAAKSVCLVANPRRAGSALVLVVLAALAILAFASTAMADLGIQRFAISAREQNGTPDTQAGSHPFALTTTFALSEAGPVGGDPRNIRLELPPGLVGDPDATPRCNYAEFVRTEEKKPSCSPAAAVGIATSYLTEAEGSETGELTPTTDPVYNLVPPAGVAAEFGYIVAGSTPVLLETTVRTGTDYGLDTSAPEINQAVVIDASKVTIWGVPAAEAHNPLRGSCIDSTLGGPRPLEGGGPYGVASGLRPGEDEIEGPVGPPESNLPVEATGNCATQAPLLPLLSNPTSCGAQRPAKISVESWQQPGKQTQATASLPALSGCEQLDFQPKLTLTPDTEAASSPTGLNVDVKLPQEGSESPQQLTESDLKDTTLTLPAGLGLNPSAANGLDACTLAQVGYTGSVELDPSGEPGVSTPQFTDAAASCPEAAKLADVSIASPDLEGRLTGGVYLAAPQNFAGLPENPFSSLLAIYLIAEEPNTGVLIKLAGQLTANETTGQLTTTFQSTPQLPFSDLQLQFFTGQDAALSTPASCGTYTTVATFTPWSGTPPVTRSSSFNVTSGPGGTPCPDPASFTPSLTAASTNINAGAFSPLETDIGHVDGQQPLKNVNLTLPPGVSAVITGVPECGEAQANAGTCGAESQIGEVTATAGVGGDPITIPGGRVYLTGPYDGAPFGLSIVTPAVAGPFNLGNVVVRARIEINSTTGAVTVRSGAIPRILRGIPLQIKRIEVNVDRPGFMINPTSCDPLSVNATIGAWEGAEAAVAGRFQLANCQNLKFAPKFSASTAAHTSRGQGASLVTKIEEPAGALTTQANIARVKVQLPKQLPSELRTLQKACLAKTFEVSPEACTAESPHAKVGEAVVHTPLLPVPLTGNAYLVSHGGEEFPNLTIVLKGDNVTIVLVGDTNIAKGITTTTFKTVPDVPFTSFELTLPEEEDSALGAYLPESAHNSFCGQSLTMPTEIVAQNGMSEYQETKIAVTGCPPAVAVTKAKVKGDNVALTVRLGQAGTLVLSGKGIRRRTLRRVSAGGHTITVSLTAAGRAARRHRSKLKITAALSAAGKTGTITSTITP